MRQFPAATLQRCTEGRPGWPPSGVSLTATTPASSAIIIDFQKPGQPTEGPDNTAHHLSLKKRAVGCPVPRNMYTDRSLPPRMLCGRREHAAEQHVASGAATQRASAHVPWQNAPWCKLSRSARCLSQRHPEGKKRRSLTKPHTDTLHLSEHKGFFFNHCTARQDGFVFW